jgi:hypothetical protein
MAHCARISLPEFQLLFSERLKSTYPCSAICRANGAQPAEAPVIKAIDGSSDGHLGLLKRFRRVLCSMSIKKN